MIRGDASGVLPLDRGPAGRGGRPWSEFFKLPLASCDTKDSRRPLGRGALGISTSDSSSSSWDLRRPLKLGERPTGFCLSRADAAYGGELLFRGRGAGEESLRFVRDEEEFLKRGGASSRYRGPASPRR